jgi:hypothetical protein
MSFIDLSFAVTFNLITDTVRPDNVTHSVGKTFSFIIILVLFWVYIRIGYFSICKPYELSDYETQIVIQDFNPKRMRNTVKLRLLNIGFKIKIMFLVVTAVTLQNSTYACVILMSLIQILSLLPTIYYVRHLKNLFESKVNAFCFLMTEMTITLFLMICLFVYGKEDDLSGYRSGDVIYSVSGLE